MTAINFDTNDYQPSTGSSQVYPRDDYIAILTSDELRQNKNKTGNGILFEFQIVQGNYAGGKFRHWINFEHQNQQTVDIGRAELRALADACGVVSPRDTTMLYNKPLIVSLGVEYKLNTNTGAEEPFRNNVESFSPNQVQREPQTDSQQHTASPYENNQTYAVNANRNNGGI